MRIGGTRSAHFMHSHSDDTMRVFLHERFNASRGCGVDRIVETGSLEVPWTRLLRKAILDVAFVILVGLGLNEDRVIETYFFDEGNVFLERIRIRLVGRVLRQREFIRIRREHMHRVLNQWPLRPRAKSRLDVSRRSPDAAKSYPLTPPCAQRSDGRRGR